jgi:peroxiredoxin
MKELGELERRHADFAAKNTRIVAASIEPRPDAQKTQAECPDLTIISDNTRSLVTAFGVLHEHAAPDGSDTAVPTTLLIDKDGVVRWVYRPERVVSRLSPDEVLTAIDKHLTAEK